MKKRVIIFFLLIALSISFVSAVTINVPSNFPSIQSAINNASAGDIINVSSGMYSEDILIPKNKTGLELKSDDSATIKGVSTVISTSFPLAVPNIQVDANNVKIHGFNIMSPIYIVGFYSSGLLVNATNLEIYNNTFLTTSVSNTDDISQAIQTYSDLAIPGVDVSGLNIHNNIFTNQGIGTYGYEGIYINPSIDNSPLL